MSQVNYFTQCISGLVLLISASAALASDVDPNEKNTSLTDARVPTQYLPIEKSNIGNSISYTFIDRTSVKLHPYNKLIRTYTSVINYGPALLQDKHGKSVSYRSTVIKEYVNCDKKEYAKGLIETYENYFGAGELQSSDNLPKRWEAAAIGSKQRQNLIIICSLALNN